MEYSPSDRHPKWYTNQNPLKQAGDGIRDTGPHKEETEIITSQPATAKEKMYLPHDVGNNFPLIMDAVRSEDVEQRQF